jgi:hypothetical protein
MCVSTFSFLIVVNTMKMLNYSLFFISVITKPNKKEYCRRHIMVITIVP